PRSPRSGAPSTSRRVLPHHGIHPHLVLHDHLLGPLGQGPHRDPGGQLMLVGRGNATHDLERGGLPGPERHMHVGRHRETREPGLEHQCVGHPGLQTESLVLTTPPEIQEAPDDRYREQHHDTSNYQRYEPGSSVHDILLLFSRALTAVTPGARTTATNGWRRGASSRRRPRWARPSRSRRRTSTLVMCGEQEHRACQKSAVPQARASYAESPRSGGGEPAGTVRTTW